MKTLISICTAFSIALVVLLLLKEFLMDPEGSRFGATSIALIAALAAFAALGLLSLLLLRNYKKAIEGIWLSFLSTIVVYIAIDYLAGQFLLEKLSPRIVKNELVHHKLIPGTVSEFITKEFRYIQRVNSIGFRGKDIEVTKAKGTYRILMLGDSFTMGKGVGDDNTFSALLEHSLSSSGRQVQVINAGVDSYSPILSYRQLVTQIDPGIDPDLIILNFDMSDLIQEVAYRKLAIKNKEGEIIGFQLNEGDDSLSARIKLFMINNLYFTRLIYAYWVKLDTDEVTVENTVTLANPELLRHTMAGDYVDRTSQWQNVFESILKIRDYCADRDIQFLLTAYPWGHQVNDDEWTPGRYEFVEQGDIISDKSIIGLEAFATNESIDFVNLFNAFRSYDDSPQLYFDLDMHWTVAGHQFMASELEKVILREYLDKNTTSLAPALLVTME